MNSLSLCLFFVCVFVCLFLCMWFKKYGKQNDTWTNRARRPHDINRRRSGQYNEFKQDLSLASFSLFISLLLCLSACLPAVCVRVHSMYVYIYIYRCGIEQRYLFKDIFSSYFIWFARRPLVITLLSSLLSLDYFHFRCCPSRSLYLSFTLFISFWLMPLPFRILFGNFLLLLLLSSLVTNVHELILFLCDMNDDFWLNEANERARNETWFESNVRIISFGFWFHSKK